MTIERVTYSEYGSNTMFECRSAKYVQQRHQQECVWCMKTDRSKIRNLLLDTHSREGGIAKM
jgi:hypothetical protein